MRLDSRIGLEDSGWNPGKVWRKGRTGSKVVRKAGWTIGWEGLSWRRSEPTRLKPTTRKVWHYKVCIQAGAHSTQQQRAREWTDAVGRRDRESRHAPPCTLAQDDGGSGGIITSYNNERDLQAQGGSLLRGGPRSVADQGPGKRLELHQSGGC